MLKSWKLPLLVGGLVAFSAVSVAAPAVSASPRTHAAPGRAFNLVPSHVAGSLDCNGFSTIQKTILRPIACTDIKGTNVNTRYIDDGHFYDNGHYIGHDEPDMAFFDNAPGSGNKIDWSETLPKEPALAPTVATPGRDVTHTFELSVAPWFGMALCDGNSYPQLPCTPNSDSNAPACAGVSCPPNSYPGGGSAFLEMQFYPPGDAPFIDSISCDNTHWCASLHINEAECTLGFVNCNNGCSEPTDFAFVQTDGKPTGAPNPQAQDPSAFVPNAQTLLMNPGDKLKIHIGDAPAPGVPAAGIPPGHALEVSIDDLTTGQIGFMQASAFNGFTQTNIQDCNGRLFNFEPEYSSAKPQNIVPWAAISADVSTEFEIGHWVPCTSVNTFAGDGAGGAGDPAFAFCVGPYENANDGANAEQADVPCFTQGDTHGTLKSDPNPIAGCLNLIAGDLDFDGSSYLPDYPTGTTLTSTSRTAQSFVQQMPTWAGQPYSRFMFQTDSALSEASCDSSSGQGCSIPPHGSYVDQPGGKSFYPYWSVVDRAGTCSIEFGNVRSEPGASVNTFGGAKQFGTVRSATLGYAEFEGRIYDNSCPSHVSQGYLLSGKGGEVVSGGDAPAFAPVHAPTAPIVGIKSTSSGKGYFAVSSTGVVSTAGDATFHGDLSTLSPPVDVSDIVGIAPTTDDRGYWLIGADGGEFAFGDAKYHGSLPGLGIHVTNIVGMVATPGGKGYLIVGGDGGVFAFGATHFFGSLPGIGVHVSDVKGILPSAADTGYILVGADGGAFVFGHGTPFHGSLPGEGISVSDIVGIALTSDDGGYWMAGSNGTVYPFGDARSLSHSVTSGDLPITGITNVLTDQADAVLGP